MTFTSHFLDGLLQSSQLREYQLLFSFTVDAKQWNNECNKNQATKIFQLVQLLENIFVVVRTINDTLGTIISVQRS